MKALERNYRENYVSFGEKNGFVDLLYHYSRYYKKKVARYDNQQNSIENPVEIKQP